MNNVIIKDIGEKNSIILNESKATAVRISIKGNNNRIIVDPTATLKSLKIEIEAHDSEILIGKCTRIVGHLRIASGRGQSIIIGDYTTF